MLIITIWLFQRWVFFHFKAKFKFYWLFICYDTCWCSFVGNWLPWQVAAIWSSRKANCKRSNGKKPLLCPDIKMYEAVWNFFCMVLGLNRCEEVVSCNSRDTMSFVKTWDRIYSFAVLKTVFGLQNSLLFFFWNSYGIAFIRITDNVVIFDTCRLIPTFTQ